jgi:hypothetical protein
MSRTTIGFDLETFRIKFLKYFARAGITFLGVFNLYETKANDNIMGIFLWQNLLNYIAHLHLSLSRRPLMAMHVFQINLKVCRVSSGNPNHPYFITHTGSTKE